MYRLVYWLVNSLCRQRGVWGLEYSRNNNCSFNLSWTFKWLPAGVTNSSTLFSSPAAGVNYSINHVGHTVRPPARLLSNNRGGGDLIASSPGRRLPAARLYEVPHTVVVFLEPAGPLVWGGSATIKRAGFSAERALHTLYTLFNLYCLGLGSVSPLHLLRLPPPRHVQ